MDTGKPPSGNGGHHDNSNPKPGQMGNGAKDGAGEDSNSFLFSKGPPKFCYTRKEKQNMDLETFEEEEKARAEARRAEAEAKKKAEAENGVGAAPPPAALNESNDAILESDITNGSGFGGAGPQELQDEFAMDEDQPKPAGSSAEAEPTEESIDRDAEEIIEEFDAVLDGKSPVEGAKEKPNILRKKDQQQSGKKKQQKQQQPDVQVSNPFKPRQLPSLEAMMPSTFNVEDAHDDIQVSLSEADSETDVNGTDSESASAKKKRAGRPRKEPQQGKEGSRKVWKVGSRGRPPKDISEEELKQMKASKGDDSKKGGKKTQLEINGFFQKTGAVVSKKMADDSLIADEGDHKAKKRKVAEQEEGQGMVDEQEITLQTVSEEDETKCPVVQRPGDLTWAGVGLAPYWPCCVTPDPDLHIWTMAQKAKGGAGDKWVRQYHVQFFGRVSRAWVSQNMLMDYKGIDDFNEKGAKAKAEAAKLKKATARQKLTRPYFPKDKKNRGQWDAAVQEAAGTESMEKDGRLDYLRKLLKGLPMVTGTPKPKQGEQTAPPSGSSSRKRKRQDEDEDSETTSTSESTVDDGAKRRKFVDVDEMIKGLSPQVLEDNKRKLKTGFKLFQLVHLDKAKEASNEELSKAWNELGKDKRTYYQQQIKKLFRSGSDDTGSEEETDTFTLDSDDETFKGGEKEDKSATPKRELSKKTSVLKTKETPSNSPSVSNSGVSTPIVHEMVGVFKKESCCYICEEVAEKASDLIKCRGSCQRSFHTFCLQLDPEKITKTEWKCQECTDGKHMCMLCSKKDGEVERCNVNGCGKFMHRSCLKSSGLWPQARYSGNLYTCPAHMCHTCASDNPKDPYMKYNSKLLKCIRCPTAYHSGDHCTAAGTVQITSTQIVCPKHFMPKPGKKAKNLSHTNANWCFICSKGGTLICCETCPTSFHTECLKIEQPEGQYHCDNCETGRMPLYGEVLWVKLGGYRWWPAQVVHPARIPANIERLQHDVGEFAVQFCGTKEYYWMTRGRCFLYESGDADRIPSTKGSQALEAQFTKGVQEASKLFDDYTEARAKREEANAHKVKDQKHLKPPLYTRIQTNRAFGDCPVYTVEKQDQQLCDCDVGTKDPCGESSECLNRLLRCECRPGACLAGDKCGNQRFQKRIYPKMQVTRTTSRGWGLTVHDEIKKGAFIIEYVGELITMAEFYHRMEQGGARKEEHNYYYMTVDNNRMIDAGPKGNMARFMNHSCDPNCETQKWTVNGDTRVGLFAVRDVPAGAELTFNYQFEAMGENKQVCLCGAKNCSGFIGEKPAREKLKEGEGVNGGKDAIKKKKKKVKDVEKVKKTWEDICFRCYEDGELLMCDWKNCPKVYHLACLGRDKMPREKWFCPWHHCVECGKAAVRFCIHCPNAYCKKHDADLMEHTELGTICDEHEDDVEDLVQFYRQVVGGVTTLVKDPNVAQDQIVPQLPDGAAPAAVVAAPVPADPNPAEEIDPELEEVDVEDEEDVSVYETEDDTETEMEYEDDDSEAKTDDEAAAVVSPSKGYQCSQCSTRAHKFRLEKHLINIHGFTEDEGKGEVRKIIIAAGGNPDPPPTVNVKSEDDEGEPLSARLSSDGKDYACPLADCGWTCTRRQRLQRHFVNKHAQSEDEAAAQTEKIVAAVNDLRAKRLAAVRLKQQQSVQQRQHVRPTPPATPRTPAPAKDGKEAKENVPTHILTGKKLEVLLRCPVCKWAMRGSNLYRHVSIKHPKVDLAQLEPERVEPKVSKENLPIINCMTPGPVVPGAFLPQRRPGFVVNIKKTDPRMKPRLVREEDKASSPGHSLCTKCGKYIHITNTARHWRMKHPDDEYSPSKMKHNQPKYVQDSSKKRKAAQIRKPKFDGDSDEEEEEGNGSSDEEDEDEVPYDDEEDELHLTDDEEDAAGAASSEDIQYCDFPDCKFSCLTAQEMDGHREAKGHPSQKKEEDSQPQSDQQQPKKSGRGVRLKLKKPQPLVKAAASKAAAAAKHVCGECDYQTNYSNNMKRHKRRHSHWNEGEEEGEDAAKATKAEAKAEAIEGKAEPEVVVKSGTFLDEIMANPASEVAVTTPAAAAAAPAQEGVTAVSKVDLAASKVDLAAVKAGNFVDEIMANPDFESMEVDEATKALITNDKKIAAVEMDQDMEDDEVEVSMAEVEAEKPDLSSQPEPQKEAEELNQQVATISEEGQKGEEPQIQMDAPSEEPQKQVDALSEEPQKADQPEAKNGVEPKEAEKTNLEESNKAVETKEAEKLSPEGSKKSEEQPKEAEKANLEAAKTAEKVNLEAAKTAEEQPKESDKPEKPEESEKDVEKPKESEKPKQAEEPKEATQDTSKHDEPTKANTNELQEAMDVEMEEVPPEKESPSGEKTEDASSTNKPTEPSNEPPSSS